MAPPVCECTFPFNLLITLSFDCSGGRCYPDTDLGVHLTFQAASRSYVTACHSKCAVFVLLLFACTDHGISFCSAPPLALVAIIGCLVVPFNFVEAYLTFLKVVLLIVMN